jgi:precorrin-6B methylase 2
MEQQSRRSFIAGAAAAGLVAGAFGSIRAVHAQEYATPFGPSSQDAVNRMIKLAALRDGDVVADLGSGNGQIIIAAAKSNPKVRGWGVDLQEWLVKTATEEAAKQGVSDRAQFSQRNAFDVDLREVNVINMWLFANLTRLLQPKILAEARPGTRVIVNGQLIGTENILGLWQPDQIDREGSSPIMLWIVPARVQGYWTWDLPFNGTSLTYDVIMNQAFQQAEGFARVGNRRESLTDVRLRGEDLSFVFDMTLTGIGRTKHEFSGKVNGESIKGVVKVSTAEAKPMELPWTARRVAKSGWFRPTGIDFK